jgi:glycerol kinase
MNQYLISIDQGTTSCRALLIDKSGHIVGMAQQEFTQIFPQAGWVEHDAEEIYTTQIAVIGTLIDSSGIALSQVSGVGITNQRETTVVWNKHTGKPIHNALVWQDRRTSEICDQLKAAGHESYVRANTGLVIDAYFSGTKVKWILDHIEGARQAAAQGDLLFGTIDTWLIWKMTQGQNHVTDYTNASRTMIYNIVSKTWDDHMLSALDIPRSVLPQVQASSSDFGSFIYRGVSIPICGVAGDQQAALFGQACFSPGMAKNTYGTGCFMLMNCGDQFVASKNGLLTTLACNEKGEVCYALEGSVFIAGAGVQWLRDGLKFITSAKETEEICLALKDDHDVIVVPAFAGLGAPYWDMYARGAMYGLTRGTTDKHIVKATVDAIAYQTKDIISAMEQDMGDHLSVLKVDGGACANNYLMQFQSDILGADVERPQVIESTAMGAAYLAGMYLGWWDQNVIKQNRSIDHTFTPALSEDRRTSLYDQWRLAVKRTMVS